MESGNPPADDTQLNIQNDYFNTARKNRTRVTIFLTTGQRISGMIRSFDRFTLILDTRHGDQMVFKHAIATVAPSHAVERDHGRRPGKSGERGGGRPRGPGRPPRGGPGREGPPKGDFKARGTAGPQGKSFGNYMDLSALAGEGKTETSRDRKGAGGTPPKGTGGKAQPAAGGKPEGQPGSEAGRKAQPAAGGKPEGQPGSEAGGKPQPAAGGKPEGQPGSEAGGKAQPAAGGKPEGQPGSEAGGKAQPAAGGKPEEGSAKKDQAEPKAGDKTAPSNAPAGTGESSS